VLVGGVRFEGGTVRVPCGRDGRLAAGIGPRQRHRLGGHPLTAAYVIRLYVGTGAPIRPEVGTVNAAAHASDSRRRIRFSASPSCACISCAQVVMNAVDPPDPWRVVRDPLLQLPVSTGVLHKAGLVNIAMGIAYISLDQGLELVVVPARHVAPCPPLGRIGI